MINFIIGAKKMNKKISKFSAFNGICPEKSVKQNGMPSLKEFSFLETRQKRQNILKCDLICVST